MCDASYESWMLSLASCTVTEWTSVGLFVDLASCCLSEVTCSVII